MAWLGNFFKKSKKIEIDQKETITENKNDLRKYVGFQDDLKKSITFSEIEQRSVLRKASEDSESVRFAMDDNSAPCQDVPHAYQNTDTVISPGVSNWFLSQTFIGHQMCALLAQNWMIQRACSVPSEDAIRKGYEVTINSGEKIDDPQIYQEIRNYDKEYKVFENMSQFVTFGKVFGVRVAMFDVKSSDPEYYEKPFNPDGVTPKSYQGIVQIDPYWLSPLLDSRSSSDPTYEYFYEPTWWMVNGKKIHRTHLCIYRYLEVPDLIKPSYYYGGLSLTQCIYERVYSAERTANEAPLLALTKRTLVHKSTDLEEAIANPIVFENRTKQMEFFQSNYGRVFIGDGDDIQQLDTALADLDTVIKSQYELIASIAGIPSTKLLGTSPQGMNATGEFESKSYHETLESLQNNVLSRFLERHLMLLIRSEIAPKLGIEPFEVKVVWPPIASLDALSEANVNKTKSETGINLIQSGAITPQEERSRIISDPCSGYNGLEDFSQLNDLDEDGDDETSNSENLDA